MIYMDEYYPMILPYDTTWIYLINPSHSHVNLNHHKARAATVTLTIAAQELKELLERSKSSNVAKPRRQKLVATAAAPPLWLDRCRMRDVTWPAVPNEMVDYYPVLCHS